MGLVTCNTIGESLQFWIQNASNQEKSRFAKRLQDILEINSGDGLTKWLKSADDSQLKQLADAFSDILKLDAGEGLAGWIDNASQEDKDKLKTALTDGLNLEVDASSVLGNLSDKDLEDLANKLRGKIKIYSKNPISGDGSKDRPINLDLAGGDNLLDIRDDGLNYSEEAPADTSNLFVDSEKGDDNNTGTREKPLRSIQEVLKRNKPRQAFNINLHEDQTHEWRSSWGDWINYNINLTPYGEVCDRLRRINPVGTAHWERSNEVPRPTIKFMADRLSDTSDPDVKEARSPVMSNNTASGGVLSFHAMILDFSYKQKDGEIVSGLYKGYFGQMDNGCDIFFRGCYFIPNEDSTYYLAQIDQADNITVDCSSVLYNSSGDLYPGDVIILGDGAFLSISFRRTGLEGGDEIANTQEEDGEEGLTFMKTMSSEEWGRRIDGIKTDGLAVNIRTTADLGL